MKQRCDICQKERKGKHFGWGSNDVVWCDKCTAKCPPPAPGPTHFHPGLKMQMSTSLHLPFYMMNRADWAEHGFHPGVITNGDPLNAPQAPIVEPKKPKPPPKHLTKGQSAPIGSTVERLKLQLKAGLDDEGRPLKDVDRRHLERQIDLFEEDAPEDVDSDEAAAIASILGTP